MASSSKHKQYSTKYSYSIIWKSILCWFCPKSGEYKAYLEDVEQLKMSTSLENIIVSIHTLKTQVKLLIENNNRLDFDGGRF